MTSLDARRVSPATSTPSALAAPPARRARRPSWRDPRLVVGVVLVAGSVLLGARVLSAGDETVPVWVLREDLAAGQQLSSADLEVVDVHFETDAAAQLYLPGDVTLPDDAVLGRAVGAGELLPRAAVSVTDAPALVQLPLEVSVARLPRGTDRGSVVDVWATPTPEQGAGGSGTARRVLSQVPVVSVGRAGSGDVRQVLVGLTPEQAASLGTTLGLLSLSDVLLVLRTDSR